MFEMVFDQHLLRIVRILLGLATHTKIHVSDDGYVPKACCMEEKFGEIHTVGI